MSYMRIEFPVTNTDTDEVEYHQIVEAQFDDDQHAESEQEDCFNSLSAMLNSELAGNYEILDEPNAWVISEPSGDCRFIDNRSKENVRLN